MLKQTIVKWTVAAALATPIAPILAGSVTRSNVVGPVALSTPSTTSVVKKTTTSTAARHLKNTVKKHTKKLACNTHRRVTTNSHKLRGTSAKPLVAKHHNHVAASTSAKHPKAASSTSMSILPTIEGQGQRT